MEHKTVHKTHGDGRWFSGDALRLRHQVDGFINKAEVADVKQRLVGGIAPHAGYDYSGAVAGYSFRALRDNAAVFGMPETVVVLGLSHQGAFSGVALMDGDTLESPLGRVELDQFSAAFLVGESNRIRLDYGPHSLEHSAENEIPFVQAALPKAKLVVGIMGEHTPETIQAMAQALHRLAAQRKIVVVASTDLLHDPDYELVTATDKHTLKLITSLDVTGLESAWRFDHQVCCGIGPVLTLMKFAELQGCKSGRLLYYRNSGDDYPESRGSWVVGYGAVVF